MVIDEKLRQYKKQAKQLERLALEVGFFEDATYPDGEKVSLVAITNEFGAPSKNQPPRPFFRNAIANNKDKWINNLKSMMAKGGDTKTNLEIIGVSIKEDIQQSIMDFNGEPLKESTVKAKMRGNKNRNIPSLSESDARKPLERTLLMRDSVESKVTEK